MKFRISQERFLAGLQHVQSVVSTRPPLPILSNVLIEAEGNDLRLTTTDLDILVSATISRRGEGDDGALTIEEPGAVTLPVRRLVSIVRELPGTEVEFQLEDESAASINSGNSHFRILGLPPDEFPPTPVLEDVREFKVSQKILREGLRKTAYAISTDETRYVLNGIFCQFKEGKMTLVATDGRRLAMTDADLEFPESAETSIIIPTKTVNELQRLLRDDAGEILINLAERQISFELNQNLIISKLIEGNYPNFRQVIPGNAKHRVTLDREVFLEAAQRVALLAQDKTNPSVRLKFTRDNIEISATSQDIGDANESLSVKYSGPDMSIAFNPEFLMAPFRNLDSDEVHLDLIDEVSPGVIRINTPFLYVLMPMRTSQ